MSDHPVGMSDDYAAALFALLLWLAYESLHRKARDAISEIRHTGLFPITEVFHLPRGPGPPLLQVFRL